MTDDPNASPGKILVGANADGVYKLPELFR